MNKIRYSANILTRSQLKTALVAALTNLLTTQTGLREVDISFCSRIAGKLTLKQRLNRLFCMLPDIQVVCSSEFLSRLIPSPYVLCEGFLTCLSPQAPNVSFNPDFPCPTSLLFFLPWPKRDSVLEQRKWVICVGFVVFIQDFSSAWCDTTYIRLIVISLWQISLKEAVIAAFVAITKSLCLFYWLWNSELKSYKYSKIAFMLKD